MWMGRELAYLCVMKQMVVALLALAVLGCEPDGSSHATAIDTASVLNSLKGEPGLTPRDSALAAFPTDSTRCNYIEGEFNVPEAMEVIFGLYDREVECSRWICKARELPSFAGKASREGVVHTRAAGAFPFVADGQKKVILLTETLSRDRSGWESCHACAPILGAALFSQVDSAWFVEALQKNITEIGAWGELPARNLVKIGPETYAIALDYTYSGQGNTIGGTLLVAFGDGTIRQVADVHTRYSNEDMFLPGEDGGYAYSYTSTISFQEGSNTHINDLVVATTGRRPSDGMEGTGSIKPFQEQRVYVMHEGSYVLYDSVLIAN